MMFLVGVFLVLIGLVCFFVQCTKEKTNIFLLMIIFNATLWGQNIMGRAVAESRVEKSNEELVEKSNKNLVAKGLAEYVIIDKETGKTEFRIKTIDEIKKEKVVTK